MWNRYNVVPAERPIARRAIRLRRGTETISHTLPAASERHPRSTTTRTSARASHRRRRVVIAIAAVFVLALVALGIQSWRVVSAIVDVEQAAVVPLPTRETDLVFGKGGPASPVPEPTSAPAQTAQTPPSSEPTHAPTSPPDLADDAPSRLEVLRQIVDASMADGDPGRSSVWGGKTDLYLLVIGVDRRPDGGDQNADVIIIAHLDLERKRLAAVSIPRDLLVEIPGVGPDKINGAYNQGVLARPDDPAAGVAKVRDTVEQVFGVPIDGYVLVDFRGFEDVVDAVGGIEVEVPYEIYDDQYPTADYGTEVVKFSAGRQHLDGDEALKYVRTRHADSDDARRQRQLDVILAIFDRGKSVKSLARADRMILAAGDSIQTSFRLEEQLTLARLAFQMKRDQIAMTTLGEPLLQPGSTEDGRWVYVGDMTAVVSFVHESLRTDQTIADAG